MSVFCQILNSQIDIENMAVKPEVDLEIEDTDIDSTIRINLIDASSNCIILTQSEVQNIITHREKYGDILEECELLKCGFNKNRIRELLPYLDLNTNFKNKITSFYKSYSESNWKPKIILGSTIPSQQFSNALRYGKIQLQRGKVFQASLSIQSDPYEKGLDYFSGAIKMKIPELESSIILGKYIVDWNQGLVKNIPYAAQFTQSNVRLFHNIQNIRSSSSWNEYQGYWGIAIQKRTGKHQLFFSSGIDFRDGNIETLDDSAFSKFIQTGKHINNQDIIRKNSIYVWNNFLGYTINKNHWNANFSISHYEFSRLFYGRKNLSIPEISISVSPAPRLNLTSNAALANDQISYKLGALYQAESNISVALTQESLPLYFPIIDQSAFLPIKINNKQSIAMLSIIPSYKKIINMGIINRDPIYRLKEMKIQTATTNIFIDYEYQTKKERFKIRLQSIDSTNYRASWSLDYYANRNLRVQQKSLIQGNGDNLGGLISIGTFWNYNKFKLKTFAFAYESKGKTMYITRNAIQLPWELQIVSGSGVTIWGLLSYKFSRFSLHSSVEIQLKRESETYLWQKPRIFAQITIP